MKKVIIILLLLTHSGLFASDEYVCLASCGGLIVHYVNIQKNPFHFGWIAGLVPENLIEITHSSARRSVHGVHDEGHEYDYYAIPVSGRGDTVREAFLSMQSACDKQSESHDRKFILHGGFQEKTKLLDDAKAYHITLQGISEEKNCSVLHHH